MFGAATDVAITEVAFKAPVPAATGMSPAMARLGAGVLEFLQRQAAALGGSSNVQSTRDVLGRFKESVATVETAYEIDGGPAPGRRTVTTLGLWWTTSIYCTTREAFEPWRYNATEASQLQIEGARLREDATRVRVNSASAPIDIDARELSRRLPKLPTRRVYSLATGEPRRMQMGVRTAPAALLCLQLRNDDGPAVPTDGSFDPSTSVAAFVVDPARGLVWTEAAPASGSALMLRTPVHRQSLGSPLVTGAAVVGLVASPNTAWDARTIAAAAARALRVTARPTQRAGL